MKDEITHAIEHMFQTHSIRKVFWHMDEKVADIKYGIRQGDDAIIVGKKVVNMEGPYPLKIGRKTGLIHTCCDIVVMGAQPLFALDSLQVNSLKEAEEIAIDIKKQSDGLGVPILGGNTQFEPGLIPCISFAVIGELVKEPIPDSGAMENDRIIMLGEIMEGEIGERVYRAKTKFETFLDLIKNGVEIHAAKDASRGGWFGNLTEMMVKARLGASITSIPYPRLTRYMGTYLVMIPESEVEKVIKIAVAHKCPFVNVGIVTNDLKIKIGKETVVEKKKMQELIRKMPFKKPY